MNYVRFLQIKRDTKSKLKQILIKMKKIARFRNNSDMKQLLFTHIHKCTLIKQDKAKNNSPLYVIINCLPS